MNILQISSPKSGSYWLHSILSSTMAKSGIEKKSFIKDQPVYQELKEQPLSFKGQAGVDMMDIEDQACYYRISSLFREPIYNLQEYISSTSLAWTHSTYCNRTPEVLKSFQKKVYIVRDPRDRALSTAKFAFTPYMQKHYPSTYATTEEYLEGEFERLMQQWVWHVGNYLLHKDELDLHFVFYENLLLDFEKEFGKLLNYLGLDLSKQDRESIAAEVSFSSMKNKSPKHLQKGRAGKWEHQLEHSLKDTAIREAGNLLKLFGYPLNSPIEGTLPRLPQHFSRERLKEILSHINWQELYPEQV